MVTQKDRIKHCIRRWRFPRDYPVITSMMFFFARVDTERLLLLTVTIAAINFNFQISTNEREIKTNDAIT